MLQYRRIVKIIYDRLQGIHVDWAITGSLGFVLHGMDIEVNDIDIQTDELGAYEIEKAFEENVVRKVEFSASDKIQSHFGELNVDGVKIEIMGALQKRLPNGVWEPPVEIKKYREFVEFEGMKLPLLSLDYEERAYRRLGRTEKANRIKEWLTSRSLAS